MLFTYILSLAICQGTVDQIYIYFAKDFKGFSSVLTQNVEAINDTME